MNGFNVTTDYVLGLDGEQVTEMQHGVWQHTNVFAGGKLLATYDQQGLHFYLDDPLGTRRAQTDYAGNLEQTCTSLPFGDDLHCSGSIRGERLSSDTALAPNLGRRGHKRYQQAQGAAAATADINMREDSECKEAHSRVSRHRQV